MDNNIIDKRTPGTWIENKFNSGLIESDNGEVEIWQRNGVCKVLGDTRKGEAKANVSFIVKACNEYESLNRDILIYKTQSEAWHKGYDKLESANRELLEALKGILDYRYISKSSSDDWRRKFGESTDKALEAIKKHSPIN